MRPSTRQILIGLALFGLTATPAVSQRTETDYGVGLVFGYDTNPLRVMSGGPPAPDGTYAQLRLQAGATYFVGSGSTSAFFANAWAATRFDPSATEGAGQDTGSLRAGVAISPAFGGHRFVVAAGGRLTAFRGTFVDQTTGLTYEANVDPPMTPPSTITIPDRLDHDTSGAFLNLRWKQNPRWTFYLDTSMDHTDYVEDYQTNTDLDRLDYDSLTFRPGVNFKIADVATLGFYASFTDMDYDSRPALDASGSPVPDTRRRYEYAQYGVTAKVQPLGPWSLDVGLAGGGRNDTYAGYYDSASGSALLAVGRELGERNRLRIYSSMRDVDYDNATISGDPADDQIRSSQERRYAARFLRNFGERLLWYFEGGIQQSDSRDPVFAHDRDWVLTGIQYGR